MTLKFLLPQFYNTPRPHLSQWFHHAWLVTDNDLEGRKQADLEQALAHQAPESVILDITHNPIDFAYTLSPTDLIQHNDGSQVSMTRMVRRHWSSWATVLHNDYSQSVTTNRQIRYFPIWLWAWSLRRCLHYRDFEFDCVSRPTRDMMCLNGQTRAHRTRLHQLLRDLGSADQIQYSLNGSGLPEDQLSQPGEYVDMGVGHPVYARSAVNLVTETSVDWAYVSEKSCKPFAARQIPVLVGAQGITAYLASLDLDMFEDLIPWRQWDSLSDSDQRLQAIADFVDHWIRSGRILSQYHSVWPRLQRNKQWFHSEQFRNRLMSQMPDL